VTRSLDLEVDWCSSFEVVHIATTGEPVAGR